MEDMHNHKLIDKHTHLQIKGILSSVVSPSPSITLKDNNPPLSNPAGPVPCFYSYPYPADVTHYIVTKGPPVFAPPRRLAPDRHKAAKREFEHMLQLGIICLSSKCLVLTP